MMMIIIIIATLYRTTTYNMECYRNRFFTLSCHYFICHSFVIRSLSFVCLCDKNFTSSCHLLWNAILWPLAWYTIALAIIYHTVEFATIWSSKCYNESRIIFIIIIIVVFIIIKWNWNKIKMLKRAISLRALHFYHYSFRSLFAKE
jgi:hypothetical protein